MAKQFRFPEETDEGQEERDEALFEEAVEEERKKDFLSGLLALIIVALVSGAFIVLMVYMMSLAWHAGAH